MSKLLAPTQQGHETMEKLNKGSYECVVCMAPIRRFNKIWYCQKCFTAIHSTCMAAYAAGKPTWLCPVCRTEYDKPPKATCFCGKHVDGSKYEAAHCCGEICGKLRVGTSCPHPCTHKCHAGPCGPCTAGGKTVKCYCGRKDVHLGCGEEEEGRSCGQMCLKPMKCGHACITICHKGECPKCAVQVERSCYCGAEKSKFSCGDVPPESAGGVYSCKHVCGKVLSCGKHHCTKMCHEGPCEECPTPLTIQVCACGRTKFDRKECTDPIDTCEHICGKTMKCGHVCQHKCHFGPCVCDVKMTKRCRCGCQEVEVKCGDASEVLCDTICGDLLSCGIHKCDRKCCLAHGKGNSDLHKCFNYCGKELPCGHKCTQICHGNKKCPPCTHMLLTPLTCRCGKTQIQPPVPCGTAPPQCNRPCQIKPACGHVLPAHNCHFGPCPRCVEIVEKPCFCGKGSVKIPCYIESGSCGNVCGKPIGCGQHKCQRVCHEGPCTPDGKCPYLCGKKKGYCTHFCNAKCHGDSKCPHDPCDQIVECVCRCGHRKVQVVCGATPEKPWEKKTIDCNLDCLKEHVRQEKVGVNTKRVEYPMWFLCLYDAAGKAAKTLETNMIDFINNTDLKTQTMNNMNQLMMLVFSYLCSYYQLNIVPVQVKKAMRYAMEKQALNAVLCSPPAFEEVNKKRNDFHPKGYDMVINVIVYDTDYEDQTMMIHITSITENAYDKVQRLLKKIQYNCRIENVNKNNAILFFKEMQTLEFVLKSLKNMKGFVVRDDLIVETKEVIVLKNKDNSWTDVALRIIYGMINDALEGNTENVRKVMMHIPAYSKDVLTNYTTVYKSLISQSQPVLALDVAIPKHFYLNEIYVSFSLTKTIINQNVGLHKNVLTFDIVLYIGVSEEKRVKVNWKKQVFEEGKKFVFEAWINKPEEIELLKGKKLSVWTEFEHKEVIGNKAGSQIYIEARFLPVQHKVVHVKKPVDFQKKLERKLVNKLVEEKSEEKKVEQQEVKEVKEVKEEKVEEKPTEEK
ncbi:nuclear transcription factor, X-box binding protein, putative [Entamoeba invadens IP1]|uniref:Nuclear transcription factor, X-box binding protein, putative n=1 Tax=Entamoeba invadens IP1 TaxID=370355 RepID=A0A0A1TYV3_ENTIV|nr:nuclear transcription factor, X-box binding protein, putative [Entamoeba invadens IP1]ELP84760.1 nuclear transcription factor, X-box binding protein, putative [Entamoeba invadens IP1]|eukprot:XP_004184106.1 nuclear transcription factor, X-box binding protein, putative [Entamoeba invadens IP1]